MRLEETAFLAGKLMVYTAAMNRLFYVLTTLVLCALTAALTAQLYRNGILQLPTSSTIEAEKPASNSDSAIALLETRLAEELQLRQILEQENDWLQALLDEQASVAKVPPNTAKATIERPGRNNLAARSKGFDVDKLRQLGLDDVEISRIEDTFNELELQKIYLVNEAQRGSWIRSKRFRDESRQLQDNLRASLDNQQYDLMLYASGQNNRVEITSTLPNSPAESAGILSGDKIIQYGEQAIYSPKELHDATIRGEAGELVAVTVQRGNETLTVYLPRGPIGTRFRPGIAPPLGLDN